MTGLQGPSAFGCFRKTPGTAERNASWRACQAHIWALRILSMHEIYVAASGIEKAK